MMKSNHTKRREEIFIGSINNANIFLVLVSIAMIAVSIYMTKHYFELYYPKGIGGSELSGCRFNSWLNCDITTLSALGSIFNIPTSLFGGFIGVFFILGSFFPTLKMQQSLHTISILNLAGCLTLLGYSLFVLKGLCPVCCLYYLTSLIAFLIFHKSSKLKFTLDPKIASVFTLIAITVSSGFAFNISKKEQRNEKLSEQLLDKFNKLKKYDLPSYVSPYFIEGSLKSFQDTKEQKVNISIFSDFQCPACKMLSDTLPKLISKFKGKININYYFYPLDQNCNEKMKFQLHPYACKAALVAACNPEKDFHPVHDEIFKNQEQLNDTWLINFAKKSKVLDCYQSKNKQLMVSQSLEAGEHYQVSATPTMVLENAKINALIPQGQLFGLIEKLIEEKSKVQ